MPPKPAGNVFQAHGSWYARIPVGGGKRKAVKLPFCTSRDEALVRASLMAELVDKLRSTGHRTYIEKALEHVAKAQNEDGLKTARRIVDGIIAGQFEPQEPDSAIITIKDLGDRWTSDKLHKLYPDHVPHKTSSDDDKYRLNKHIYPHIKDIPIKEFRLEHAQLVMQKLPTTLSASSRRQVAQLLRRMLAMAVFPLRLIDQNPIPPGFLPKVGPTKALTYLYPDEDRQLMSCAKVPIQYRILYGFLAREGPRSSEAAQLTFADVDLKRGVLTLDENKTDDPRAWALDPGVVVALKAWRDLYRKKAEETDRIFVHPDGSAIDPGNDGIAEMFRAHLKEAKVTRDELFKTTNARRQIRIHDLRATFVTLALATGRSEAWVQDRTGHRSSQMLNRYRRTARTVTELGLGRLAALDRAIPEFAPKKVDTSSSRGGAGHGGRSGNRSGNKSKTPRAAHARILGERRSGPAGTRTLSLRIKSPLLYQLSYWPGRLCFQLRPSVPKRARPDSNGRPADSKSDALSS